MNAPQIIYLSIIAARLLYSSHKHGQQLRLTENFWIALTAQGIIIGLLYWGGFFS